MKKVRISESDFNRLVKRIINESANPGLLRLVNLFKGVSKSRAIRTFENMLSKNQIDDFIVTDKGVTIKIQNGEQVLDHFINGRLRSKDQDNVFRSILQSLDESNSDDLVVMNVMTDFLLDQPKFLSKYKNLDEIEQLKQLEEKYGETASEILVSKLKNKNIPKNLVHTFWKMNLEAWAVPGLAKTILMILRNPANTKAWGNFVRWVFTGTTRDIPKNFKAYFNEMKQFGFSTQVALSMAKLLLSVGLENFQRWLVLSFVNTFLSTVINQKKLAGTPQADEELKNRGVLYYWDKFLENWKGSDYKWVFPVATIGPIVWRIIDSLVLPLDWDEKADYVINKKLPVQRELITLDNRIMQELPFVV